MFTPESCPNTDRSTARSKALRKPGRNSWRHETGAGAASGAMSLRPSRAAIIAASPERPRRINQRGLSGIHKSRMEKASEGTRAAPNIARQYSVWKIRFSHPGDERAKAVAAFREISQLERYARSTPQTIES